MIKERPSFRFSAGITHHAGKLIGNLSFFAKTLLVCGFPEFFVGDGIPEREG